MINKIINGNAIRSIDVIGGDVIDCVVTSPPYYKLRKYDGTTKDYWDGDITCNHIWTKYKDYNKCSLCGMWYGELGNEPTPELYVKHLVDIFDKIKSKMSIFGTIWINIGTTMSNTNDLCIPELLCLEMIHRGFYKKRTKIWNKSRVVPMSIYTDNTPSFEHILHFGITNEHTFALDTEGYVVEPTNKNLQLKFKSYFSLLLEHIKDNTIERYKIYATKGSNKTKTSAGLSNKNLNTLAVKTLSKGIMYRNKRSVWNLRNTNNYTTHSASFPDDLPYYCILQGCPEYVCLDCGLPYLTLYKRTDNKPVIHKCRCGTYNKRKGLVLDPFAGSGTTLAVADRLGRDYIGFEISDVYCNIINRRLKLQHSLDI